MTAVKALTRTRVVPSLSEEKRVHAHQFLLGRKKLASRSAGGLPSLVAIRRIYLSKAQRASFLAAHHVRLTQPPPCGSWIRGKLALFTATRNSAPPWDTGPRLHRGHRNRSILDFLCEVVWPRAAVAPRRMGIGRKVDPPSSLSDNASNIRGDRTTCGLPRRDAKNLGGLVKPGKLGCRLRVAG